MNSRNIKHKIAISCKGNLKKYFSKVAIVNRLLNKNCNKFSDVDLIYKVNSIFVKK